MKKIALSVLILGTATTQAQTPPTPGELGVVADHHLHVRTKAGIEALSAVSKNMDEEHQVANSSKDMRVISAADLISHLDEAGIKHGTVLSSAYFFGMPEFKASAEERRGKTQELNNIVADEIAQYPGRLRGFCGVNPLLDFAEEEVTRCVEELGMAGVKVHFANSNVSLSSPEHLSRLRVFFTHVRKLELPVALHLRTRSPEFGQTDVMNFINEVVVHVPGIELYIAHLSGWGGYDAHTHEALMAWAVVLESGVIAEPDKIRFDIAATVTRHPKEENALIAQAIRRLGTQRIYLGSDWPAFNQPRWVPINFRNNVPLTEAEHKDILNNVASYFE